MLRDSYDIVTCAGIASTYEGKMLYLPQPPDTASRALCFMNRVGESLQSFYGIVYLSEQADPSLESVTDLISAGAIIIEMRTSLPPYSPQLSDPQSETGGYTVVSIGTSMGLIQRQTDHTFVNWDDGQDDHRVHVNLIGGYSPTEMLTLARSLRRGVPA